ncbi:isocitrate lyase/PEP mutase family protein [Agrococcus sp. SGAir0287]|uniref:isocitrate lyase/PEP mutase family protein n=1 Tax=Agrococcus sp. SGAir0287 TaxID=2070347 RepID=UPI0010CD6B3A|nr:isocitrate lyase/phosphoenolpyruvate mutase family protein [Agrococcus sp. SGAir0287]QCR19581.1 isocitrate lyase/phosphoenolpyruvate mutase family protein [Agrococcus sp. SGAir0287]
MTTTAERATELLRLHRDPSLLKVVNVWDPISASAVAGAAGTSALATASHSIAATLGYEDGERIPVDEMLDMVRRIVVATDLPVTADLEGGYGDAPETVRRAIELGVVGANVEDQLQPVDEAAAQVEAIMRVARDAGVPDFVLNARTDAFVLGGDRDRDVIVADALERGRAYLDAGAPVVFVPGPVTSEEVRTLVDAFGPQRLTTIAVPGTPSFDELQVLGVARVSFGPISQRVALTALQELAETALAHGELPGFRVLN